jgi:hypothetical protein
MISIISIDNFRPLNDSHHIFFCTDCWPGICFGAYNRAESALSAPRHGNKKTMIAINGFSTTNLRSGIFGNLAAAVIVLPLAPAFGVAFGVWEGSVPALLALPTEIAGDLPAEAEESNED